MDETHIKVKGVWKYLYRAVDKEGKTVDFLLTTNRDKEAALRFFYKAMKARGAPKKVTMDKSAANKSAMDEINGRGETLISSMVAKFQTEHGKLDHRKRKWIAEPPNGWIKNFLGFRQFRMRGLENSKAEFKLVCLALNLCRIRTMRAR